VVDSYLSQNLKTCYKVNEDMCRRLIIIKNHMPKLAPHGTLMVHVGCN